MLHAGGMRCCRSAGGDRRYALASASDPVADGDADDRPTVDPLAEIPADPPLLGARVSGWGGPGGLPVLEPLGVRHSRGSVLQRGVLARKPLDIGACLEATLRVAIPTRSLNSGLLVPIGDAALREIVRRHLALHPVALQHPDVVLAHLSREVRVDFVAVFSRTQKVALGRTSMTVPSISIACFAMDEAPCGGG